jgi:hypothetical protein
MTLILIILICYSLFNLLLIVIGNLFGDLIETNDKDYNDEEIL